MTVSEAARLIAVAAAAFPRHGYENLEQLAHTWALIMPDIGYEQGQAALIKVLRKCKFFPTPSEVLAAAATLSSNDIPSVEAAWLEVSRQLDIYRTPTWSHPAIAEAVRVLGFRNLCASENPAASHAQFERRYTAIAARYANEVENSVVQQITSGAGAHGLIRQIAEKRGC